MTVSSRKWYLLEHTQQNLRGSNFCDRRGPDDGKSCEPCCAPARYVPILGYLDPMVASHPPGFQYQLADRAPPRGG